MRPKPELASKMLYAEYAVIMSAKRDISVQL